MPRPKRPPPHTRPPRAPRRGLAAAPSDGPPPEPQNLPLQPPPHYVPEALRLAAAQLPACPGVYTFHGEEGGLPLYIGKSIHLRQRVQSHLRNPDEARMLAQTRRISHICTAGEVGALLLEAQLIKRLQPLMNQRLRRNRQLCALHLPDDGPPTVVDTRTVDFARTPRLHGLFASRHAALERLWQLADEFRLCGTALGLEKLPAGKACFRHMVKRCAGLCCGNESAQAHRERLLQALAGLQLACWPHPGAVGLLEEWQGPPGDSGPANRTNGPAPGQPAQQIHVVRDWCYLGSVAHWADAQTLDTVAPGFDADGYHILCKPMLAGQLTVRPL